MKRILKNRLLKKVSDAIVTYRVHRSMPLHIEFNLSDHCNLNCKGCSHYSPLAPAEYDSVANVEKSMKKISRIKGVEKIREVYLIGGETLLYPHLEEMMQSARRYFPRTVIKIFTNGLLLPKMSDSFWAACKQWRIELAITRYPVKFDYDGVEKLCRQKGVPFSVFGDRSLKHSFLKFPLDPEKKQNPRISHFRCSSFGCITVDHGRIFPCSQSACVNHYNKAFNKNFQWEEGDFITVDELRDVAQILHLRNRPVPFCGYCARPEFTIYGPSHRTEDEWG